MANGHVSHTLSGAPIQGREWTSSPNSRTWDYEAGFQAGLASGRSQGWVNGVVVGAFGMAMIAAVLAQITLSLFGLP